MYPQSRGGDSSAGPKSEIPADSERAPGLGILSIDPAASRDRSYTIDTLNISPIETAGHVRLLPDPEREPEPENDAFGFSVSVTDTPVNLEKATWEFSDILQSISGKDKDDLGALLEKCNRLVPLLAEHPMLKHEVVIENVLFKVQFMLSDPRPQARAAAYRVLRHASATPDALHFLVRSKLLIFIIVSLSTPTPLLEKEQALKLVREFVNVKGGVSYLSVGVVKALVSYVEHEADETQHSDTDLHLTEESRGFTRMCIETISEIAVANPDIVFHAGGLRLLIGLTTNGSTDVSISCLPTLLTLLDMPHARLFLRNGADLDGLMAVFTLFEDDDADGKATHSRKYHAKAQKMSFVLACLLKTWSGLICFSHDNFGPVRTLLSNLRKRNARLCTILLDLLLDILRIQSLPWLEDSEIGDLLASLYGHIYGNRQNKDGVSPSAVSFTYQDLNPNTLEYGVISHYQGLLSKVLLNCGLVPLLFNIINENRDEANTAKATRLLSDFLDLCASRLPSEFYSTHILSAYTTELSLTSLGKIETATRMRGLVNNNAKVAKAKLAVREMTQHSRVNMKDGSFKALVTGTRVLLVKEFDEWNWSLLSQLFQGPLRSSARFLELQEKYPKFLKTFLSFLRPFKYRFSSLPAVASSKHPKIRKPKIIINVACQLIEALLASEEGSQFLAANKLMPQIAEVFAQIDPHSGIFSKDPLLGLRRLEHSLSLGYVRMVGILSGNPRGIEILRQWQLFHMMSNIIDATAKEEKNNFLVFHILQNLDYTNPGHARIILKKAMCISNWKIKLYAIQNVFPVLCTLEGCEQFYVENLVYLIYDSSDAVTTMAVECLHDYFIENNNFASMDMLIECNPSINILEKSEQGRSLLLNFCITSKGFAYLEELGYIDEQFTRCIESLRTLEYLILVEDSLRQCLFPYMSPWSVKSGSRTSLRHFFNYLLATEEGFNYFNARRAFIDEAVSGIRSICRTLNIVEELNESGQVVGEHSDITSSIYRQRASSLISEDSPVESHITPKELKLWPPSANWAKSSESIYDTGSSDSRPFSSPVDIEPQNDEYLFEKLKQYIWVIGEIASSKYGIQILEPAYSPTLNGTHIAATLSLLFEKASHWQLRGLAFFQLGKMAGTVEGVEILDDLNWISFSSQDGSIVSLAYPKFMQEDGFTRVEVLNPYNDVSYFSLFGIDKEIPLDGDLDLEDEIVIESYEEIDEKILTLFNYLSSVLGRIERKATKELTRIKAESPQVFNNTNLFLKTIRLIDKGKFKYRIRKFIFELFNTMKILEGLVKKDRKNSSVRRLAV